MGEIAVHTLFSFAELSLRKKKKEFIFLSIIKFLVEQVTCSPNYTVK